MKFTATALLAIALLSTACGAEETTSAVEPTQTSQPSVTNSGPGGATIDPIVDGTLVLPDGWFELAGYSTVLHVAGDVITSHYITESTCVIGETVDNELPVDRADATGVITIDLVGPTTEYRLRQLTEAVDCAATGGSSIDAVTEVFASQYPFFAERDIDAEQALAELRAEVGDDPDRIYEALTSLMVELGDGHTTFEELDIDPDPAAFGVAGVETIDDVEAMINSEIEATLSQMEDYQFDATGTIGWGHLAAGDGIGHSTGGIGYLIIGGFDEISGFDDPVADRAALVAGLDQAVADLDARFDQIIVDVRFNGGGYEDFAVLAAGYFTDEPAPAYHKWAFGEPDPIVQTVSVEPQKITFGGDVVVVTGPITASAAETFLLAMRETTSAPTLVGNPSWGEFSDAIDWRLPNGLEFTMSMEVYTDLQGNNYEAVGVPVDIASPFDEALQTAIAELVGRR